MRLARALGEPALIASALEGQASVLLRAGRWAEALPHHQEMERIFREIGDQDGLQRCLGNEALVLSATGDREGALRLHREEAAICRDLGDHAGLAYSLLNQGSALEAADPAAALEAFREGVEVARRGGARSAAMKCVERGLKLAYARRDLTAALALHGDEEALHHDAHNDQGVAGSLARQGHLLEGLGRGEEALQAYERSLALDPPNTNVHTARANTLKDLGRVQEALAALDAQERALGAETETIAYNRACYQALAGDKTAALAALDRAIALDPANAGLAVDDPDFASLRDDPDFEARTLAKGILAT
jgi:tetratricopeptide (TPR) repeat protein